MRNYAHGRIFFARPATLGRRRHERSTAVDLSKQVISQLRLVELLPPIPPKDRRAGRGDMSLPGDISRDALYKLRKTYGGARPPWRGPEQVEQVHRSELACQMTCLDMSTAIDMSVLRPRVSDAGGSSSTRRYSAPPSRTLALVASSPCAYT